MMRLLRNGLKKHPRPIQSCRTRKSAKHTISSDTRGSVQVAMASPEGTPLALVIFLVISLEIFLGQQAEHVEEPVGVVVGPI
jgi:hypothetical protein